MRVEVVAIGTELLLGQIVNTNSAWIGEQLALGGLDSFQQTTVGDNRARIVAVIEAALQRSDAVICCGGLGPTQDDLTREALAEVLGERLEPDEEMEERIIERFAHLNRRMPMNNLRQAERPASATFIEQMPGTAPGLVCPLQRPGPDGEPVDKVIYAVPGVPWEMKEMVLGTVLPDLQRRAGLTAVIASRTLRTWGESESGLAERLAGRIAELDQLGNPTLAFLASGIEGLKVRITAKGATIDEVTAVLDSEEALLRAELGPVVFGVDDDTMESVVLQMLRDRGLTLAVAESLTGGLVAARLVDVPGASDVLLGGVVAYDSEVKFDLLGVTRGPVISETCALEMATGVRRLLGADVAIATTGVAGPDPQEGQPPGTVCMAVVIGDPAEGGTQHVVSPRFTGGRQSIRDLSAISLLALLRRTLSAHEGDGG